MKYSYDDYISGKVSELNYYNQFVSEQLIRYVKSYFGTSNLMKMNLDNIAQSDWEFIYQDIRNYSDSYFRLLYNTEKNVTREMVMKLSKACAYQAKVDESATE